MPDFTKLIHHAMDLSGDEDYAGAIELLTQVITDDPGNARAYNDRGMALLNLNRHADAMADFDRALAISPDFPGARDWRARTAELLGDHQSAAEDRLKDLREHPDGTLGMGVSPQRWADCAQSFINAGNPGKAKELLEEYFFGQYTRKVTSYTYYETAPMRLLARLLIQAGDVIRACEFAHRAYSSQHHRPMDLVVYALALEASSDLANARRVCAEAMKWNDKMPGLKELKGRLFE